MKRKRHMQAAVAGDATSLPSGATVCVTAGPFAGCEGFYLQSHKDGFHYVELEDHCKAGRWLRSLVPAVRLLGLALLIAVAGCTDAPLAPAGTESATYFACGAEQQYYSVQGAGRARLDSIRRLCYGQGSR